MCGWTTSSPASSWSNQHDAQASYADDKIDLLKKSSIHELKVDSEENRRISSFKLHKNIKEPSRFPKVTFDLKGQNPFSPVLSIPKVSPYGISSILKSTWRK